MMIDLERTQRVAAAAHRWAKSLIDTSGNNRLLYYRDLKAGTLNLAKADPVAITRLLTGTAQTLGQLFPEQDDRADAQRRLRTIRSKMRELAEERGLDAGYVVTGMATWREPERNPRSPVILHPLQVHALSATETDFRLRVDPSPIINPVLLFKLSRDHGLTVDEDELLSQLPDNGFTPAPLLEKLAKVANRVPDFRVTGEQVVGTFLYEKLPMVQDIERNGELLASSDVIAALAGDIRAATALASAVPVDVRMPDTVPLGDEFLVLDADSSQSYAINAVVAGQHLVIKGPPGTGKSQTIANIIAALAARGRTTLFVAEKRAAIDAVLDRLKSVDLDDLVVNLHGGGTSRRELAQALGSRLQRVAQEVQPHLYDLGRQLTARRAELVAHDEMLHRRHAPWGLSAFEVQAQIMGLGPEAATMFRWRGRRLLQQMHGEVTDQLRDAIGESARLGAFDGSQPPGPWKAATIDRSAAVPGVLSAAGRAAYEILPKARQLLDELMAECGLKPPQSLKAWRRLLTLIEDVAGSLDSFAPSVFAGDLARWIAATADRRERKAAALSLRWSDRRAAVKELRAVWTGSPKPTRRELHTALLRVADQMQRWQAGSRDGGLPRSWGGLPAAAELMQELDECLAVVEAVLPAPFSSGPVQLQKDLNGLASDQVGLQQVARRNELRAWLLSWNMQPLMEDLQHRRAGARRAQQVFQYAWLASILDQIRLNDVRYAAINGEALDAAVTDFRRADRQHVEATPSRIRRAAAAHLVAALDTHPEQQQLVRREAAKKRRHLPVRDLFHAAPDALKSIKPCWAMSPLLVSQVLPPQRLFDVVIFDEASQVEPVDGITSIMRGRQIIVAGDEHQLPPTRFFDSADVASGDDDDAALTDDVESLLHAFATALPLHQVKHLAWHYRSRDERLIAFSNLHIYAPNGNELVTFPGAVADGGLSHVLVDGNPIGFGPADRVGAEVERVVQLILEHADSRPDESLGVITMGIAHATRIDAALRRTLLDQRSPDGFFRDRQSEPFFVKSIERVQGDERDAIILSIGYGKGPDGRMLYRFGPINNEGGHRRLNVAVTRARRRATLVSSFSSHDMDPNRLNSLGAKLLRGYLEYAESGGKRLTVASEEPALNPFEADVRDRLTAAGIPLVAQFGASGYRIDFAAQHPRRLGEMILAIEADGATYHSSATARDRDRLRQEHLERLGWRFHRIWSTEWFQNREREIARAKDAYESAVKHADRPAEVTKQAADPTPERKRAFARPVRIISKPWLPSGLPITEYDLSQLVTLVRWIESDGLLRTEDQIITEAMEELGYRRRGSRISAALKAAIQESRRGRPQP